MAENSTGSAIGTALGSFAGPFGAAIGGALGGMIGGDDDNRGELMTYQRDINAEQRREEYDRQKEFAQMGIRWKSDDARAAGLHPMAVLGSQGSSYSPTVVAAQVPAGPARRDYSSIGEEFGRTMGQNLTRPQMATKTPYEIQMEGLALERATLQNRLLEGQVQNEWAALMGQPSGPTMPAATGPLPTGSIKIKPSETISRDRTDSGREAASTPGVKNFTVGGGLSIDLPGQAMSESLESMGPGSAPMLMTIRGLRNKLHGPDGGPGVPPPAGSKWVWSPFKQSFSLEKIGPPPSTSPWHGAVSGRGSARR